MSIEFLLPNGYQAQQLVDVTADTLDMSTAPTITYQTITSTKATIPSSAKTGRKMMIVKNLDDARTMRIGGSSITEKIGLIVEPKKSVKILLDPNNAQTVWAIAIGAELSVEVIEV